MSYWVNIIALNIDIILSKQNIDTAIMSQGSYRFKNIEYQPWNIDLVDISKFDT